MNEPDAYALEEALRLREKHGGEVVVCSAGPARVQQVIREALARGADRAHSRRGRLARRRPTRSSPPMRWPRRWPTRSSTWCSPACSPTTRGTAQTGVVLAERLGIPHSTIIMEVQIAGRPPAREARARRRLVPVDRDAAAGAADDPERHQPAALRHAQGHHGGQEEGDPEGARCRRASQPAQQIVALALPIEAKQTQMIAGSPAEAAKELVRRLRDEARAL